MSSGEQPHRSKAASLSWVGLCFVLCFSSAWAWLELGPKTQWRLLDAFIADLWATLVIFGFSRAFRNSSFYDSFWSLAPPFFLLYWCLERASGADDLRLVFLAFVVGFWSIRLTLNWALHWDGLHEEDWRYAMLRGKVPRLEFFTDLFLIHVFPTGQVFLGLLPIYAAASFATQPLGILDYVAFGVGIVAVVLELVADIQLHRFVKERQPGQVLDHGLWGYSRHPNYFGEFLFWLSLALFGWAALPSQWWWQGIGALAMLLMLLMASIPMMEERMSSRPDYQSVIERVSMFVPWPPKKT